MCVKKKKKMVPFMRGGVLHRTPTLPTTTTGVDYNDKKQEPGTIMTGK